MKYLLPLLVIALTACTKPDTADQNAPACNPPANQPAEQPEPEPKTPPEVTLGKLEPADAPEQTKAIGLIETVTGLKFKTHVPVYVYTPEELEQEMAGWGDDGFTPDNVLGFYKWSTKAFYLVPEAAGNKRAFGLRIHEATHALQDQHYDLAKLHAVPQSTDAEYALLALIEGEAVQVMIDALIDTQPHVAFISKARAPEGSTDPDQYRTVFVYAHGTAFVQALKEVDGYAAVHAAFGKLPVSSEQVLHPEKYTSAPELPDRLAVDMPALKAALPAGWTLGEADTLGEFETRMVFVQQEATVAASESIAAGWGGDVVLEAESGGKSLSLWVTTWDSVDDAREFFSALPHLPDLRQSLWDEQNDPRRVILVRGSEGLGAVELSQLVEALEKTRVEYDPAK